MVIALLINVVLHIGIRNRRAEEIVCVNGELNFLADGRKVLRAFHRHLEFGFFVFLHFEITCGLGFADGRGDVVIAQRRLVAQIQFTAKGAARGQRQFLFEYFAVIGIFDRKVHALAVEQLITVAPPLAQDAFEINFLCRAVN